MTNRLEYAATKSTALAPLEQIICSSISGNNYLEVYIKLYLTYRHTDDVDLPESLIQLEVRKINKD